MPRLVEVARLPFPEDPDLAELREQALRRGVSVRISAAEKFKRNGRPFELYARGVSGNPMLASFSTAGEALEWITAGAGAETA